jgi:hypothetical protein
MSSGVEDSSLDDVFPKGSQPSLQGCLEIVIEEVPCGECNLSGPSVAVGTRAQVGKTMLGELIPEEEVRRGATAS